MSMVNLDKRIEQLPPSILLLIGQIDELKGRCIQNLKDNLNELGSTLAIPYQN